MARRLIDQRRRVAYALLVVAVALGHWIVANEIAQDIAGWGHAARMPEKFKVTFVREIKPQAPPAVVAAPRPKPKPRRPPKPAPVVAPAPVEQEPAPAVAQEPEQAEPPAAAASEPTVEAPAQAVAEAASAPAAAPVLWPSDWPASTRLSYQLTGWYRGEVKGSAQVEWLRQGSRYQVHVEVIVGLAIAPLMSRRMSSEGELTPEGLAPSRYDEETKVALREPRRVTMLFEPDAVVMPDGGRRERWPGMQDTASQFVHLTWLFTTQPQRLTEGSTLEMPLALPRNIDRWVFDVKGAETVSSPFGELPAIHIKPRRITRPGGDLVVETWFAPTLQYLPVRFRIHQDAETFIDLVLERPPLQADR